MSSVSDGGYEGLPFWYSAQSVVAYVVSGLGPADGILRMAVQFDIELSAKLYVQSEDTFTLLENHVYSRMILTTILSRSIFIGHINVHEIAHVSDSASYLV